jgi:hypothetical protein
MDSEIKAIDEVIKPFIAKSYCKEQSRMKQDMLEFCPKLDELLDIDALEAGEWSFDDEEWILKEGETSNYALRCLLYGNIVFTKDLVKMLSFLKLDEEGLFIRLNGKAFDSSIMLFLPPIDFIRDLLSCDYLSLFDCIFLIGYNNDNDANIVSHSIDIVAYAIASLIVSPRDPETYLKWTQSTKKRLTGEVVFPDLSWLLTFDEAESWAVNSFGTSLKALHDRLPIKPPAETVSSTEPPTNTQITDKNEPILSKKPAYLEENNPMFSRELFIAIEAWEQVLSSNPSKPKRGSRKTLITQWLEKNHRELTNEAKERIAVMINPDGNGGTPKTPMS